MIGASLRYIITEKKLSAAEITLEVTNIYNAQIHVLLNRLKAGDVEKKVEKKD